MIVKLPGIRAIFGRLSATLRRDPDRFLWDVSGVIHVGANAGQERDRYDSLGLRVLWIEPIPMIFKILQANIKGFPNQRAIQGLVTDRDDESYQFHLSNNSGLSSSILDLKQHKDIWPDVHYVASIPLTGTTLTSLLQRADIDPSDYQALVMDTQGSELLVLRGAVPVLQHFRYIKTEVPDFESYADCCQLADIDTFMTQHGFRESSRDMFANRAEGGSYYDVVYRRRA